MQWWIDEPKLLGSHNPSPGELNVTGLKTVISLLDPSESHLNYSISIPGVRWLNIPVQDFSAPSLEQLNLFIKQVETAPGTVMVHCQGGCGRTGTFGAAWLMHSRGLNAEDAVEVLRLANPCAVETVEQMRVLQRWRISQSPSDLSSSSL